MATVVIAWTCMRPGAHEKKQSQRTHGSQLLSNSTQYSSTQQRESGVSARAPSAHSPTNRVASSQSPSTEYSSKQLAGQFCPLILNVHTSQSTWHFSTSCLLLPTKNRNQDSSLQYCRRSLCSCPCVIVTLVELIARPLAIYLQLEYYYFQHLVALRTIICLLLLLLNC